MTLMTGLISQVPAPPVETIIPFGPPQVSAPPAVGHFLWHAFVVTSYVLLLATLYRK